MDFSRMLSDVKLAEPHHRYHTLWRLDSLDSKVIIMFMATAYEVEVETVLRKRASRS